MMENNTTLVHFERDVYLEAKRRALFEKKTLSVFINESLRSYLGAPIEVKWDETKAKRYSRNDKVKAP